MIRISAVSYTNTIPFIYGLEHSQISNKISLSLDVPFKCAEKLRKNEVDIGLIPVAEMFKMPAYQLISNYCIGADGPVNSVFIFSNAPIAEVTHLQLDPQSRTSNMLAKVLIKNFWKLNPVYLAYADDYALSKQNKTAFVQIGDRTFGQINKHKYVYDLAAEWKNFTGLPFVFAAWVANKPISDDFLIEFNQAIKYGLDERLTIFENLPMRKDFDLVDYLMHKIDYDLSENKLKALKLFETYSKSL